MKLTALHPIRHDGKRYAEGDVLDVSDKRQAEALISCGSAEAGGKPKSSKADAIAVAEKALAEAQAALAAATDDAKPAAQKAADEASAALQALKA